MMMYSKAPVGKLLISPQSCTQLYSFHLATVVAEIYEYDTCGIHILAINLVPRSRNFSKTKNGNVRKSCGILGEKLSFDGV